MQPGEAFKVTVEWDFTVPSKVNDWSVVAYGALGPVTVTHPTWSTSDSFPFTPRAFKSTNNTTFVNTTWRAEAKADFLNWANSVGPAPPTGSGGCSSVCLVYRLAPSEKMKTRCKIFKSAVAAVGHTTTTTISQQQMSTTEGAVESESCMSVCCCGHTHTCPRRLLAARNPPNGRIKARVPTLHVKLARTLNKNKLVLQQES